MKKFLFVILALIIVTGCSFKKPENIVEYEESKEPFTVQVYYSKTCPICKQLRQDYIGRLKEEFNEQITVEEYDIDDEGIVDQYDSYMGLYNEETQEWEIEGKLQDVEQEYAAYNRYIPFVVVGDMYAFIGYTESLREAYVQDVHLALQNRPLATGDVSIGRWTFK